MAMSNDSDFGTLFRCRLPRVRLLVEPDGPADGVLVQLALLPVGHRHEARLRRHRPQLPPVAQL